jgi:MSHA biogenesis protein MshQ
VCAAAAPPPSATLDHILITQPGSALTCQPQTVTVTACANFDCSSTYTGGVTGTLTPGGSFTIPSGSASASATVQQAKAGSAILNATPTPAEANSTTCINQMPGASASAACNMIFSDNGFALTLGTYISGASAKPLPTFSIAALGSSGTGTSQQCVPLFKNASKSINLACAYVNPGPSKGTLPVMINAAACPASGQDITLSFDANGVATPTISYADVGQISVAAKYAPSSGSDAGLGASGSGQAIFAPASFKFTSIWLQQTPASKLANPEPADASTANSKFAIAGQPFSATLAALNNDGNATPNFGQENTPESIALTPSLIHPLTGVTPAVTGSFGSFSGGSATATTLVSSEVGIMRLTATLNNVNGYLGGGKNFIANGTSLNIGRFIPDHFNTLILAGTAALPPTGSISGIPMPCIAPLSCVGSAHGFVYSQQAFGIAVTAYNSGGALTQNYISSTTAADNFANSVMLSAWNASGGAVENPGGDPKYTQAKGTAITGFVNGVSNATPAYAFPAVPAVPVSMFFRATDSDGVTSLRGSSSSEDGLTVVSGKMQVANNYGSELLPMTVNLRAQFYSPGKSWVTNSADGISNFSPAAIRLFNCQKNLKSAAGPDFCTAAVAVSTAGSIKFGSGMAKFVIKAPGAGNDGGMVVQMTDKNGVQAIPYLPSDQGSEVFGIYKSGPVIYQRELY